MTDLYIATPTQADYDALMRLSESVVPVDEVDRL